MRQSILLGLIVGFLALIVMVLVLSGYDQAQGTTALASAITLIVGVLVTATTAERQANKNGSSLTDGAGHLDGEDN